MRKLWRSKQHKIAVTSKCCFSPHKDHPLPFTPAQAPPPCAGRAHSTPTASLCSPRLFLSLLSPSPARGPGAGDVAHPTAAGKPPRCPGETAGGAVTGHRRRYCQEAHLCLSLLSPARHRGDIYIPQRALVSCLLTLQSAQIPRQLSCSWAGCSLSGVLSAPRSRYGLGCWQHRSTAQQLPAPLPKLRVLQGAISNRACNASCTCTRPEQT